jgi:ornithine carbamoyltransferase
MSSAIGTPRHFLDLRDFDAATLRHMLDLGRQFKHGDLPATILAHKTLALIFEKPSTRTRVSFEVAMRKLGGGALILSDRDMQLGRGETIGDTARVLSRYVDGIMLRTDRVWKLEDLAENASIPVINGLTEASHPCQLMADVMTFEEHKGPIAGQKIAWLGDGNNVARSWVEAAVRFGFTLCVSSPQNCDLGDEIYAWAAAQGGHIERNRDPMAAVKNAACVVTDTWLSMSDDAGRSSHLALAAYQVTGKVMAAAAPGAIFMHCLPAHRGEEVTAEVFDGPRSVVFDEAENRLHAQAGILVWALAGA